MLCFYVGVMYHSFLMHFKCYDAVKRSVALFLFCSSFANHASVSGDPYVDFDRNHSLFSMACLVCQVDAMIIFFPSGVSICIAHHILHSMACLASCCLCIAPWLIIVLLLVFLLWLEPGDEFVNKEPIEYVYEEQAFDNFENSGKMIITPDITSIFAC